MSSLRWYIDRLKAMNPTEVSWRITQKVESEFERFRFSKQFTVSKKRFWNTGRSAKFNYKRLGINYENEISFHCKNIKLLGPYDYSDYAGRWHSGFNTTVDWPLEPSSTLRYKQRDDIGDARVNWELNRLHQLTVIAREYYSTRDQKLLDTFKKTFEDWVNNNPFLYGISWTSVMEVSIRAISLMYALAFLRAADDRDTALTAELETSILNCINYISRHYSRYSSANNHLLVEMAAIGIAGYAFDIPQWKKLAINTLTQQLPLQTYPDGVNREVSLHYHSFAMEAYLLTAHVMLSAGDPLPPQWLPMIDKMATFLAASMVDDTTAIEFGDNDEGKILDLQGGNQFNHYTYILQFSSLLTGKKYTSLSDICENIYWLFQIHDIARLESLPLSDLTFSRTFADGGYSILRSKDNKTIVAIDHASHGFGSIAAHGHDDALSFQLYHDGKAIFGDPGTGVYHCNLPLRNRLRDGRHHSTVTINGHDNAEMLGAFLWGRKPDTTLYISELTPDLDTIIAETIGLSGIKHRRKFTFDKISSILIIDDEFDQACDWSANLILAPEIKVEIRENSAQLSPIGSVTTFDGIMSVNDGEYSTSYGAITHCHILTINGHGTHNTLTIEL